MTLGLLHLSFRVPEASSLKDKRRIVKSFKDRLRSRSNVSVAEVDHQDNRGFAALAVAMVGVDRRYVESALQKIANQAAMHRDLLLTDQDIEFL